MVKMTHQPVSMPPGFYDKFKEALRGTRFEGNRSAAIRSLMHSLMDEKEKMVALGQSVEDRSAIKQLEY